MSHGSLSKGSLTNSGHKLVAQLVSYPMGRLWARFTPRVNILGISLNPGPFTIKEHVGTDPFLPRIFSASTRSWSRSWLVSDRHLLMGWVESQQEGFL